MLCRLMVLNEPLSRLKEKKLVRLTVDGIFLTEQNIKNANSTINCRMTISSVLHIFTCMKRFTTNLESSDSPSGICLM